jgi:geranylgeranyl diphosphate synthase, type II
LNLQEYLAERRILVDKALDEMVPAEDNEPSVLHRAMRYSLFAGGKRIRPILAFAAGEVAGEAPAGLLPLAVAIECVHTYSLIHDDLPAMDNDDLRRGKPTAHKTFGEATAILAGDALLTLAFDLLSSPHAVRTYRADRLLQAMKEVAHAAGSQRLIAGQVMDMLCEGRTVNEDTVDYIVRNKTGALIRASLTSGAILGGGSDEQVFLLGKFGENLGAVFQIRDDLLDLEGDPKSLGKNVNKDRQRGKATYPALLGRERAKRMMQELVDTAIERVRPLGAKAEPLVALARYVVERTN